MADLNRREFVKLSALSSAGLLIGISAEPASARTVSLDPLIRVGTDGRITLFAQNPEMGQGVKTALPMMIAEELDVDWSEINVEQCDWLPGVDLQFSGGSLSVRLNFTAMRQAGAIARQMLLHAAADQLQVPQAELTTTGGFVHHATSGRRLSYGELAESAANLPVPEDRPLKEIADFKLLGQSVDDVDLPHMVNGAQEYSLDVRLPDMLYAVVNRSPYSDGQPGEVNVDAANELAGVVGIEVLRNDEYGGRVVLPNSPNFVSGVAVLADNTWSAIQAAKLLEVEWQRPGELDDSSELVAALEARLAEDAMATRSDGDAVAAFSELEKTVDVTYRLPFLAHVPMEPMNCTADVRDDGITIWAATQNPGLLAQTVATALDVEPESITVRVMRSGGAFGRRFYADFAVDAAVLSQRANRPVKIVWTREDDVKHDYYRPASVQRVRAGVDDTGRIAAWHHKVASYPRSLFLEREPPHSELDNYEFPAAFIPNLLYEYGYVEARIPLGQWRAVEHSSNVFVVASVMDELAHEHGEDTVAFLTRLIGEEQFVQVREDFRFDAGKLQRVLHKAAEESGWGSPLPRGHGRGIACSYNQGAWVAEVAEVSVIDDALTVHRITAALDVGLIINPKGAEAQIEGGILEGMSAALMGEITVVDGIVEQSNFHDYQLTRMHQVPDIDVHIIHHDGAPRGLGEGPLPPVAPAICNAIFAATGERIRELPLKKRFSV